MYIYYLWALFIHSSEYKLFRYYVCTVDTQYVCIIDLFLILCYIPGGKCLIFKFCDIITCVYLFILIVHVLITWVYKKNWKLDLKVGVQTKNNPLLKNARGYFVLV